MKRNLTAGLVFAALLSACGIEPLYVQKQHNNLWYFSGKFDSSIATEMSQIKVEPIADRFGQQVRNQLLDLLTPKGTPKNPKYRLFVELKDREVTQQALRQDITATSERVVYRVSYYMMQDNDEIVKGDSVAYVSYDILANPYSTTMAQKKTETDAAKIVADDIALRLGAYFHTKFSNKGNLDDFQTSTDR